LRTYLDRNGDDVEKASGGAHDLAGALLRHLQDRLERRREAHGFEKKESDMDSLTKIVKDLGPIRLCEGICERQRAPCDEHELVAVLSKHAGGDRAFAKLYETEESVRRACNIAKAAGPMFDMTIVSPGDETRRTVNDTESSESYQTLQALADKLHAAATGKMTKEQAFAAAFSDPANRELAQKAHRRPTAPAGGAYPFPR
jgi:hypothetical protein